MTARVQTVGFAYHEANRLALSAGLGIRFTREKRLDTRSLQLYPALTKRMSKQRVCWKHEPESSRSFAIGPKENEYRQRFQLTCWR